MYCRTGFYDLIASLSGAHINSSIIHITLKVQECTICLKTWKHNVFTAQSTPVLQYHVNTEVSVPPSLCLSSSLHAVTDEVGAVVLT